MVDSTMTLGKRSPPSLANASNRTFPFESSNSPKSKLTTNYSSSLSPTTPSKPTISTPSTQSSSFSFSPSSTQSQPPRSLVTPFSTSTNPPSLATSSSPAPLYFGFLSEAIYLQLSPSNSDWRTRSSAIEVLHQTIIKLHPPPLSFLMPHLNEFLNFMTALVHDPNFKVVLTSLFALSDLIAKLDISLIQATLPKLMSMLILKLEDSKMILRQAIFKIIAQITHAMTPAPMLSIITHYLASNQPKVKEQVVNLVISIFLLFPKCSLDLANIVADLLVALIDPNPRIKYVSVEAYTVLAARYGAEKILALLKSYGLEEDTLTALKIRFTNPMLPVLTPDGMVDHIIHLRSSSSSTSSTSSSASSFLSFTTTSSASSPVPPSSLSFFTSAANSSQPTSTSPMMTKSIASLFSSTLSIPPPSPNPVQNFLQDPSQPTSNSLPSKSTTSRRSSQYATTLLKGAPPSFSSTFSSTSIEKTEKRSSTDIRASQSLKSAPTVISRTLPVPAFTSAQVQGMKNETKSIPSSTTLPRSTPSVTPSNLSQVKDSIVSPPRRPKQVEDPKNLVVQLNTGDWELQQKVLDTIQAYLPQQKHVLLPVLGELTMAVLGQVTNLRSGVARPAITTLSQLLFHCGKDMDPNLAEPILTCLLKKCSDPKEFLMDLIDRALTQFVAVHWPSNRLLPVIYTWAMHKHAGIRYKTAALLKACLLQMNEAQFSKLASSTVEQTRMVPVVLSLIRDGNKETRTQAKLVLELLNKAPEWFHLMEKLVNGSQLLDIKKALQS